MPISRRVVPLIINKKIKTDTVIIIHTGIFNLTSFALFKVVALCYEANMKWVLNNLIHAKDSNTDIVLNCKKK